MTEKIMEQEIFQFVEQLKDLLSPQMWENILLDCTKNEILILWLLFRNHSVNMTQIADYIHVPLNTATGIIARMEKKMLVVRERSDEDKRIVTIRLGQQGEVQITAMINEFTYYGRKVMESFSKEEINLFSSMMNKLIEIMSETRKEDYKQVKVRKIEIE